MTVSRAIAHAADAFHLELEGLSHGSFVRCGGLAVEREVLEYAEGGAGVIRRFPGDTVSTPLWLERGVTRGPELFDWFQRGDPRRGAVVLLAADGAEVARWAFRRGWPSRWAGPRLDATSVTVALEFLEITHEGLEWIEH